MLCYLLSNIMLFLHVTVKSVSNLRFLLHIWHTYTLLVCSVMMWVLTAPQDGFVKSHPSAEQRNITFPDLRYFLGVNFMLVFGCVGYLVPPEVTTTPVRSTTGATIFIGCSGNISVMGLSSLYKNLSEGYSLIKFCIFVKVLRFSFAALHICLIEVKRTLMAFLSSSFISPNASFRLCFFSCAVLCSASGCLVSLDVHASSVFLFLYS